MAETNADADASQQPTVEKVGTYSTGDFEREACPGCGVVSEMEVLVTEFEDPDGNVCESHHVEHECPVCGKEIEVPW